MLAASGQIDEPVSDRLAGAPSCGGEVAGGCVSVGCGACVGGAAWVRVGAGEWMAEICLGWMRNDPLRLPCASMSPAGRPDGSPARTSSSMLPANRPPVFTTVTVSGAVPPAGTLTGPPPLTWTEVSAVVTAVRRRPASPSDAAQVCSPGHADARVAGAGQGHAGELRRITRRRPRAARHDGRLQSPGRAIMSR